MVLCRFQRDFKFTTNLSLFNVSLTTLR
jgi:hypothetical protein